MTAPTELNVASTGTNTTPRETSPQGAHTTVPQQQRCRIPATIFPRYAAAAELVTRTPEPSTLTTAQVRELFAEYRQCLEKLLETSGAVRADKRLQYLQAFEDAIRYRAFRSTEPCADCSLDLSVKCNEHQTDLDLVAAYRETFSMLCV